MAKKKGKRAKTQFVRSLLGNTSEGKELLTQLDSIKGSMQLMLESK